MSEKILERLKDLAKQATTERSHFYVKKTCVDAYDEITALEQKLAVAVEALEKVESRYKELNIVKHWSGATVERSILLSCAEALQKIKEG